MEGRKFISFAIKISPVFARQRCCASYVSNYFPNVLLQTLLQHLKPPYYYLQAIPQMRVTSNKREWTLVILWGARTLSGKLCTHSVKHSFLPVELPRPEARNKFFRSSGKLKNTYKRAKHRTTNNTDAHIAFDSVTKMAEMFFFNSLT